MRQPTLVDLHEQRQVLEQLKLQLADLVLNQKTYIVYGSTPVAVGRQTINLFYGYKFNRLNQLKASAQAHDKRDIVRKLVYHKDRTTKLDLEVKLLQIRIDKLQESTGIK